MSPRTPIEPSGKRPPAGAAALSADATAAIRDATFETLAEVGYARLSIEAIARRAGVAKTTIYRRWSSKLDLVVDLVAPVALHTVEMPDTGHLLTDIEQYLEAGRAALTDPLAWRIVPDLIAESTRVPELAEALSTAVRDPRRVWAATLIERAVERGELPGETDVELALDLVAGPLYFRLAILRAEVTPAYVHRLARLIHLALLGGAD